MSIMGFASAAPRARPLLLLLVAFQVNARAVATEGLLRQGYAAEANSIADEKALLKLRFADFVERHGRRYDGAEHQERFAVWKDNAARVEVLNGQGGGAAFSVDGPFGDLSPEEFASRVLMPPRRAPRHSPDRFMSPIGMESPPLPTEFDWREEGAVTPVKDQVENLEGQLFRAQGALRALSVEQLVECDGSSDSQQDLADCGEFGGWPYLAYGYLEKAGGIHTDEAFPYCSGIPYGEEGNCMPCMPSGYDKSKCGDHSDMYCNKTTTKGQVPGGLCSTPEGSVAAVTGWKAVSSDEEEIARTLVKVGPLSVAINAALLQFYWGGIFDPYDYFCDPEALDHAVLLVGFGSEASQEFWTVKNSWGAAWGEEGYFRIARGGGKCGINTAVTSGFVVPKTPHGASGQPASQEAVAFLAGAAREGLAA